MFNCRACLAKDNHIADLQSQVENLKKLVFPSQTEAGISPSNKELHSILNGGPDVLPLPSMSPEELELHQILTGLYS